MMLFYYRYPGGFYALGPVEAANERELRARIRRQDGKLTRGLEVWETTPEAMRVINEHNRRMAAEIGQPLD